LEVFMTHRMTPFSMTLSDLRDNSSIASLSNGISVILLNMVPNEILNLSSCELLLLSSSHILKNEYRIWF